MMFRRLGRIRIPVRSIRFKSDNPFDLGKLDLEGPSSDGLNTLNKFVNEDIKPSESRKGIDDLLASLRLDNIDRKSNDVSSNDLGDALDKHVHEKGINDPQETLVFQEEKLLFQNIFKSYMGPEDQGISERIESLIEGTTKNVNSTNDKEFSHQIAQGLAPSIDYINGIESESDIIDYLRQKLSQVVMNQDISKVFQHQDKQRQLITEITDTSERTPESPILNAFTLPLLVNTVLHNLSFKFKDGQAAISLFNLLKKNIRLYTIACNQQTYNEILRTQWIYMGKSSLYNIEMTYMEMLNNGFTGDITTLNIMKNILVDYYELKLAVSPINSKTKLPIWSKEDDKRAENLESKLRHIEG